MYRQIGALLQNGEILSTGRASKRMFQLRVCIWLLNISFLTFEAKRRDQTCQWAKTLMKLDSFIDKYINR